MQHTFDRLERLLEQLDTVADRYRKVAARFSDVVAGVPPDGWSNPTPCDALSKSGHYGMPVAVPADADERTRLIALTGRHP